MSFLNIFGSEQHTDQTAYNQQAGASQGSVALGAGSKDNNVSIVSSDPEVLEAALAANVITSRAAIDNASGTAALSIAATNTLAGKYGEALHNSYLASTEFASDTLTQAIQAEHAAVSQTLNIVSDLANKTQEIQAANTPGSAALAVEKQSYSTVIIIGVAIVVLALIGMKK